ncbi:thiamine-phosphate kinase [Photobacterium carnosum]|uniref:thiamine-phosphate kinase n=1 Tax=Photobacterium carnosum TaxID=2023717 RepID=UPI001E3189B5|nr:thiamine-phosphate kinase [Photobacterium carnosum]MCD9499133.1 thiamine-phosphate kinase [Photobacterium carnosum]
MAKNEFDIINHYFAHQEQQRDDVVLAIGDDCALVDVPANYHVAISTDSLVAGTHFLVDADPAFVAYKALASNISDLAAMGATPAWVSLALTLPTIDEAWLAPFCHSFFELANRYNIQLIGGDTTKGPLSITLTVQGLVPRGQALTRSGAQVGDDVYVTGNLGDSAAGLALILNQSQCDQCLTTVLVERHFKAHPRVNVGEALRGIASAALDISDGVIADVKHIGERSQVAIEIDVEKLPLSAELLAFCDGDCQQAQQLALTSGEEYELCFTASKANRDALKMALAHTNVKYSCIGQVIAGRGLSLLQLGKPVSWKLSGWDHFVVTNK